MAHVISGEVKLVLPTRRRVMLIDPIEIMVLAVPWTIEADRPSDLGTYTPFGWLFYHPFEGALASLWHDQRCEDKDISRKDADIGWHEIAITGRSLTTRMSPDKAYWGYKSLRSYAKVKRKK